MIAVVGVVVINDKGEILLVSKRFPNSDVPLWLFPGGKVNPGENVVDAAIRETVEELGTRLVEPQPYHRDFYSGDVKGQETICIKVFRCQLAGPPHCRSEIEALVWTSRPLDFLLTAGTRQIIEALENDGYL